ncbi:MAG: hypothetical protein ABSA96_00875 [Candidatus Acidiferrales bacterium]
MSHMAKSARRLVLAAGIVSLIPASGWACSSCMAGDPKTAGIYLGMTIVMSALPMLLVGGLGYWLYRRHS